MSARNRLELQSWLWLVLVAACGSSASQQTTGGYEQPCREDGTCDRGLVCRNDQCVPAEVIVPGDPGDSASGDPGVFPDGGGGDEPQLPPADEPTVADTCLDGEVERSVRVPGLGDLVVSEVFADAVGADTNREWIEVFVAANEAVDLNGLTITNRKEDPVSERSRTVGDNACVAVQPGAYVVIGASDDPSANGGVTVQLALSGLTFFNSTPLEIELSAVGSRVDLARVPAATEGVSCGVDPSHLSEPENDSATAFCDAKTRGLFDGLGTPGSVNDSCGAVCTDNGATRSSVAPGAGDLVITEVYPNPDNPATDNSRDWLEVYVASPTAVDLNGLTIENQASGSPKRWLLQGTQCLVAAPGTFVVIAGVNASQDGVSVDAFFGPDSDSLLLATQARLAILAGDETIDTATYPYPGAGASTQLDSESSSAEGNDVLENWCTSSQSVGGFFGLGSPGAINGSCNP